MFGGLSQLATKILVFPSLMPMWLSSCYSSNIPSAVFVLLFPPLTFPLPPSLRAGRQSASVLIWLGWMSGDNRTSADTRRPCSVPSREPGRRFSTVLLIGQGKQEADFKKAAEPTGLPSLPVFAIVLKFKRLGDVWSGKENMQEGLCWTKKSLWCIIYPYQNYKNLCLCVAQAN